MTLASNSTQHADDTKKPRGAFDRNVKKKKKTEDKVLSDNEKRILEAQGGETT